MSDKIILLGPKEGLDVPFKQVLSDAVFCGNAMLSINGTMPYNAVYGRVPLLLPDMNLPIETSGT